MLFFCPELELEPQSSSWKRSPKASFGDVGSSFYRLIFSRLSFHCGEYFFKPVVLAGLRAYCYCSSWSSGLCECVHFLQLTTAAAAASSTVVVESKSTSTATTLVFGAGKERGGGGELCLRSASSSFCKHHQHHRWPNSRGHQSIQESNREWLSLQSDLGHTRQRLGHHFKTPKDSPKTEWDSKKKGQIGAFHQNENPGLNSTGHFSYFWGNGKKWHKMKRSINSLLGILACNQQYSTVKGASKRVESPFPSFRYYLNGCHWAVALQKTKRESR